MQGNDRYSYSIKQMNMFSIGISIEDYKVHVYIKKKGYCLMT